MFYIDLLTFLTIHPALSFFVVLIQFIIVMKLHYKMHNKFLHFVLASWFIPQDVVVNMVFTSILGLELPKEWLATTRLKRWKKLVPDTKLKAWRFYVAHKLCNLLNRYDAGHC